jgi:hypothetical protein
MIILDSLECRINPALFIADPQPPTEAVQAGSLIRIKVNPR